MKSMKRTSIGRSTRLARVLVFATIGFFLSLSLPLHGQDSLTPEQWAAVRRAENERISAISKVYPTVVAIYDEERNGGGSGVLISADGIALTNHHVILGTGLTGWGGLADGKLYRWKLLGTDPGGDLAVIQLTGEEDFPFAVVGDSNAVRIGDFALAMGNPFLLAEDHQPTVTLGIISGVKRYQYGSGKNELVYGNCLQVDSSINPGNSGGPLFNMAGDVIGINGRGSFADRGRVNVGLGYAISSNQVKNFFPALLATHLTEHGTLDAQFGVRQGRVVCETLNLDSPIATLGLELGDELLEFQGQPILTSNSFTNLISTMPEGWPVTLKIRKDDGQEETLATRLLGLPYQPPEMPDGSQVPEEQREAVQRQKALIQYLRHPPGQSTQQETNRGMATQLFKDLKLRLAEDFGTDRSLSMKVESDASLRLEFQETGYRITRTGRHPLTIEREESDYTKFTSTGASDRLSKSEARSHPEIMLADFLNFCSAEPARDTKITLDGGDLVSGSVCYRLRLEEPDGEHWYVWSRAYDDPFGSRHQLLRISLGTENEPYGLQPQLGIPEQLWRVVQTLRETTVETWRTRRGSE